VGMTVPLIVKPSVDGLRGLVDLEMILAHDSSLIGSDFLFKLPISI
jgi:hypothetical protein